MIEHRRLQHVFLRFLKLLDITFRRDPENYRPRINKKNSQMDVQQKSSGDFFFMDDD